MSDTDNPTNEPQSTPEPVQLPPQDGPTDTSNSDDRVYTDPSGNTYINNPDPNDIVTK